VKRVAPLQVMRRPPIPWRPAGGVFLALVGLGLMAAVAFGGDGVAGLRMFFIGVGCGIVALMFTRLSFGTPTRVQVGALVAAVTAGVATEYSGKRRERSFRLGCHA
jgi:hypothetical protein